MAGKAAWVPEPALETWNKLLVSAFSQATMPSRGHCEHLRHEPMDGRSRLLFAKSVFQIDKSKSNQKTKKQTKER